MLHFKPWKVNTSTGKIAVSDYEAIHHDLIAFISAEADFQNGILIRPRGMSEDTRELLTNIARYSVLVPAYLLAIGAKCFPGAGGIKRIVQSLTCSSLPSFIGE